MKVSQTELFGAAAILLYIVFFSHSPSVVLRNLLSNTVVSVLVLAVLAYVTMYQSRTIGVLAILAFLLTMTRVTEHLDAGTTAPSTTTTPTPPTNTPPPPQPPTPSTTMDASGNIVDASGNIIAPAHKDYNANVALQTSPGVTATATSSPAPNVAAPPVTPTSTTPPTAPATPPVAAAPPAPVMSCNIESFASF